MDTYLLDNALDVLGEIDREMHIQTIRAFLFVAHRGTCTQRDLELALKTTNASASRNISYWTHRRFDKKEGKGFVMRLEDPEDRRYKILTLTKAGKEFFETLRSA